MGLLSTYTALLCFFVTGNLYNMVKEILEQAELEVYIQQSIPKNNLTYKLHYHITPPVGFMNKPNGFLYYKNEFHLFYQYYPYDTQWGPLHWGHMVSNNLVDWRLLPTALRPGREQCFSGSAVDNEGIMILFYTAYETMDDPPFFNESQNVAYSFDGINFKKYKHNPIALYPPEGSYELRDPKLWKHNNYWYSILGSKSADLKGTALLYKSSVMTKWEFQSVLAMSYGELGYMWESPDFFEMNGKFILLITPKGIAHRDRHKNTYQTGYFVGTFNYDTCQFKPEIHFQGIDFGHDFYATQTAERNGKRYLIAWFGMWESAHPEDVEGWVGAMTLVRKLDLVGNRLVMRPVKAITKLRRKTIIDGVFKQNSSIAFKKTAEIIVSNINLKNKVELEFVGSYGGGKMLVRWNANNGKMVLDRAGDIRQVDWNPLGKINWRIFLDASSLELFCGRGEVVFSSRIYPNGDWRVINRSNHALSVVAYSLKKSTKSKQDR